MRVTKILPFRAYLSSQEFLTKKNAGYGYEDELIENDPENNSVRVLISTDFYYFGKKAISLPPGLRKIQKKGPNFRSFDSETSDDKIIIDDFLDWLNELNIGKGMIGSPCNPWKK